MMHKATLRTYANKNKLALTDYELHEISKVIPGNITFVNAITLLNTLIEKVVKKKLIMR